MEPSGSNFSFFFSERCNLFIACSFSNYIVRIKGASNHNRRQKEYEMVKNMIRLGFLATMIVVFTGTAWSAPMETQADGSNPYVLAKAGGHGPGDGTGNGGDGPGDGGGYGPGDCGAAGSADTMQLFAKNGGGKGGNGGGKGGNGGNGGGKGGNGPGDGTGNGGNGPKDCTGNGSGS